MGEPYVVKPRRIHTHFTPTSHPLLVSIFPRRPRNDRTLSVDCIASTCVLDSFVLFFLLSSIMPPLSFSPPGSSPPPFFQRRSAPPLRRQATASTASIGSSAAAAGNGASKLVLLDYINLNHAPPFRQLKVFYSALGFTLDPRPRGPGKEAPALA